MYLARKHTKRPLLDIGFYLSRKDHSTVLHGINKISSLMNSTPEFAAEVEAIEAELLNT